MLSRIARGNDGPAYSNHGRDGNKICLEYEDEIQMTSSAPYSNEAQQTTTRLDLSRIYAEPVDWRYKGFPSGNGSVTIGTVGEQDWQALDGDLIFPFMLIKETVLDGNIALMARYCRERGVSLAPHAKTPLAPQIVDRQLAAGAWGVTVATLHQARVLRAHGVARMLVANEVLQPSAVRWLAAELGSDPDIEVFVSADSVAAVAAMEAALDGLGPQRRLKVLVELGIPGGRTGARTRDEVMAVSRAVHQSASLQLAGVTGYEGAATGETHQDRTAVVNEFLGQVRQLVVDLDQQRLFDAEDEIVVSAGGSIFFDRVVAQLGSGWDATLPVRVVLRSGSYVVQDSDTYDVLSPLASGSESDERLQPALELWAMVLSQPEPGLAVLNFGKRDTSYDLHLPIPLELRRGATRRSVQGELTISALNDQHAYLRFEPGCDVAVGDVIGCGISHPCTAFDKWRLLPLVDDKYRVTGAIQTFF
jgi:D-serine deaminase-like pyridoxal phosphate-dependent protein